MQVMQSGNATQAFTIYRLMHFVCWFGLVGHFVIWLRNEVIIRQASESGRINSVARCWIM